MTSTAFTSSSIWAQISGSSSTSKSPPSTQIKHRLAHKILDQTHHHPTGHPPIRPPLPPKQRNDLEPGARLGGKRLPHPPRNLAARQTRMEDRPGPSVRQINNCRQPR